MRLSISLIFGIDIYFHQYLNLHGVSILIFFQQITTKLIHKSGIFRNIPDLEHILWTFIK